jgi:hypothetical protein
LDQFVELLAEGDGVCGVAEQFGEPSAEGAQLQADECVAVGPGEGGAVVVEQGFVRAVPGTLGVDE